jgi:hypothetical protein
MKRACLPALGLALVMFAGVMLAPRAARAADGEDLAAAESLFQEAHKLADAGNYKEACPKFLASQKAGPAVGTLLNLAACYEKLGMTASAWARYREAQTAAQRAGRADREKTARDRAQKLEPKLPKLTIRATDAPIDVKRDDVPVDEGAFGTAMPIDPGSHTITARAPGKKTWTKTITISDGEKQTLEIPPLADDDKKKDASPPPDDSSAKTNTNPNEGSGGSSLRTVSYVVMGAGVVGIGVGSYFGLQTFSKWGEAQKHCAASACDATGVSLANDAKSSGTISTISFVAGGALIVAGGVIFALAPSGVAKTGMIVAPSIGNSYGGIALVGRM